MKDSVKAPPTPEESAAAIATAKEMLPKSEAAAGRTSAGKANGAVTWVETGDAVSSQYAAARQEAGVHARVRNAYFQQVRISWHIYTFLGITLYEGGHVASRAYYVLVACIRSRVY